MKLVLIGLRGTGKSTVGRILALKLKWPFFDTDTMVQEKAGMNIRELFEKFGEPHFRKLEVEAIQEACRNDPAIIATGGGAILNPQNVAAIKDNGFVVHLSANPSELWRRISQDETTVQSRPKLLANAQTGLEELRKLLLARSALYAQARDSEVVVEDRTPDEVAEAVMVVSRAHGVVAR